MSWSLWIALVGLLFLLFAIASAYVQRLPITSSALYLAIGVVLGPAVLGGKPARRRVYQA